MSKLEIQYTREDGIVFSLELEGTKCKAGRSCINEGRLIHIPDMTDEEAWNLSNDENTLLAACMQLAAFLKAYNPHDTADNPDKKDESFI